MMLRLVSIALLVLSIGQGSVNGATGDESSRTADWQTDLLRYACDGIIARVKAGVASDNVAALEQYAMMYDRGCGVPQNQRIAEKYLLIAIAKGSASKLANGYVQLFGENGNESRGISLLSEALNSGDPIAGNLLGRYYNRAAADAADPSASARNLAEARRFDEEAMKLGDLGAAAALGYLDSFDSKSDSARRMLDKSVAAKVPPALSMAGELYIEGLGAYPKEPERGHQLLREAIAAGCASCEFSDALKTIREFQFHPSGSLDADTVAAMSDASQRLLPKNVYDAYLGIALLNSGDSAVLPRALNLLLEAKDVSNGEFDGDIAYMYGNGLGVPVNMPLAIEYERLAAQKGNPYAIAYMKQVDAIERNTQRREQDNPLDYEGFHWSQLHPM